MPRGASSHRKLRVARCSAAVILCAVALAGCTSTLSSLPASMGGLTADTPDRPASQLAYPAVHDMPPPRPTAVMTPEEVKKAEAEMARVRDRQGKPAPEPKQR
jgi:hypothetical protein